MKSRKKYRAALLLLALALPLYCLIGAFVLPAKYDDTFLGELKYKVESLADTEGKRIVLVGGSALVFGVESSLLAEAFPEYTIVNFGMYAALGTGVMYALSEPYLREGDIVIIAPEQDPQTLSDYFDGEMMWQAVDGAPSMLFSLNRSQWGNMLGFYPRFAAEKWKYAVTGTSPKPGEVYARANFNEYGDLDTEHCDCVQNIMTGGYDPNHMISFAQDCVTEEFVELTNTYIDAAQKKGAAIWYYFPPMNRSAIKNDTELTAQIDQYYEFLSSWLQCEIMGDPNNSVMDAAWFYDTNFHLNVSGKRVYTVQLIRDLKAMLGDTSGASYELPEQPALVAVTEQDMDRDPTQGAANNRTDTFAEYKGDDSDADCFLYEIRESGLWIVGLSEKGIAASKLVLPVQADGEVIAGIDSDALSDGSKLQSVTVQKNISVLPDGLFTQCRNLQAIVLADILPTDLSAGQGLLEGVNDLAQIYVEEEYVSLFKTSYAWAVYGSRIRAK